MESALWLRNRAQHVGAAKIGQEGVCEGLRLESQRWYIVCSLDPLRPVVYVPVGEFFDVTAGLSSVAPGKASE